MHTGLVQPHNRDLYSIRTWLLIPLPNDQRGTGNLWVIRQNGSTTSFPHHQHPQNSIPHRTCRIMPLSNPAATYNYPYHALQDLLQQTSVYPPLAVVIAIRTAIPLPLGPQQTSRRSPDGKHMWDHGTWVKHWVKERPEGLERPSMRRLANEQL